MPRRVGRTIAGLKIVATAGTGLWRTPGGRFEFVKDNNAITTVEDTKREQNAGYGFAHEVTWSAWDNVTGDHAFNGETGYDTLTAAVTWVAENLKKES